jgi:hypothetical protein
MKEIGAGSFTPREKKSNARILAQQQLRNKYPQFYTTKGVLKTRGISTADKRRIEDLEVRTTNKILKSRFGNAASGYIPNFAGGALDEAVAREQAAGVPINQIRINQSGKLRNAQNPQGLAVTNTRDEPTGAIPNFAKGRGGDLGGNALLISSLLFGFGGALGDAEKGLGKFTSGLSTGLSVLFSLSLLKGPLEGLSGKIAAFGTKLSTFNPLFPGKKAGAVGNVGRTITKFGKLLPVIGNIIALGAVILPIAKNFGLFGDKTEEASKSLDEFKQSLSEASEEQKKKILEEKTQQKKSIESEIKSLREASAEQIRRQDTSGGGRLGIKKTDIVGVGGARNKRIAELEQELAQLTEEVTIAKEEFSKTSISLEEERRRFESGEGGRRTALFASRQIKTSGALLRGELTTEGVGKDGAVGARAKILEEELRLAKAIGTIDKVNTENRISALKFEIEASKQRFKITQDFVKALKDGDSISSEGIRILEERVAAGDDLLEIQEALKGAGEELTGKTLDEFNIALKALEIANLRLAAKKQELDTQIEINNLQKDTSFNAGLREGLGQLREDIDFFKKELGEEAPRLFADNLGTAIKDAVQGAETLGDALNKAAAGFLQTLSERFLQQAADQATNAIFSTFQKTDTTPGPLGFLGAVGGGKPDGSSPQKALNVKDVSKGGGLGAAESVAGDLKQGEDGEGGIFGKLGEKFKNIFGELKNTFSDLFGGLKDSLGNIFGSLKDTLGGLFQNLGGLFSGGGGGGLFGGLFSFFSNGGSVGRGTDTVPAMLTPGEFVVKKDAVDKYGTSFLSALNSGSLPMSGFQSGGTVSPVSSEGRSGAISGPSNSVTNNSDFTFNIQDGQVSQQGGGAGAARDQKQFAQRIKQAVTTVIHEESRTGGSLSYLKG